MRGEGPVQESFVHNGEVKKIPHLLRETTVEIRQTIAYRETDPVLDSQAGTTVHEYQTNLLDQGRREA